MKRLLVVATEFPPGPGGIGTHASELAVHLVRRGWEVHAAVRQDYADPAEVARFNGELPFPVLPLGSARNGTGGAVRRWRELSGLVSRWRPHVIVGTGSRAVWTAAALAARHRVPMVAVGHGTEFGVRTFPARTLTRWSFGRADAAICVSRFTRDRMLEAGVRPRSVHVVPNGADDATFGRLPAAEVRALRERLGIGDALTVVTVGNVTDRKGQDVVIRALPRLLERVPDAVYLVAGLPTRREAFAALAEELGVGDRVRFLGRVDRGTLVGLLNLCDVFAMTSRHTHDGDFEGYGIAVVEAALCGAPAVVSADSGLAEAIVQGETGFGVPDGDAAATADALARLLGDRTLRDRMGAAAQRRASEEGTWAHRVAAYDAVLRGLTSGAGVSRVEKTEVAL